MKLNNQPYNENIIHSHSYDNSQVSGSANNEQEKYDLDRERRTLELKYKDLERWEFDLNHRDSEIDVKNR
jgi:hypothetical protein